MLERGSPSRRPYRKIIISGGPGSEGMLFLLCVDVCVDVVCGCVCVWHVCVVCVACGVCVCVWHVCGECYSCALYMLRENLTC